MLKTSLISLLVSILIVTISACAPAGVGTIDPNVINTSIAQTLAAITQTAGPGIPVTGDESPTPTQTATVVPATATPSPSSTAISLMTSTQSITLTPLVTSIATLPAGVVQISVSVPTNCRTGPGVAYPRVGALLVGEAAQVVGRHAAGTYWVIQNPDRINQTCWLWGQYASVVGDTNVLPVLTPPAPPPTATPAPAYDIAYEGLESCTGTGWWVDLGLENLGGVSFRSVSFTIQDLETDASLTRFADGFVDRTGCNETATRDTLSPGVSTTVSSPVLTANPTGHRLRATITLCSDLGQNGTCVTQTVNMTP